MRQAICAAALAILVPLAGCKKDTHRSLWQRDVADYRELGALFEGVTDEASARAALPRVEQIAADLQEIARKQDALGHQTPEEVEAFMRAGELDAVMAKIATETGRLRLAPYGRQVLEPLAKIRR